MFIIKFKHYQYLLKATLVSCALGVFLSVTNPNRISLGLLVVPALMVCLVVFLLTMQLLQLLGLFKVDVGKQRTISFIIGLSVGFLVMLQSIGQLQPGDAAIIMVITLVAVFYSSRFRR